MGSFGNGGGLIAFRFAALLVAVFSVGCARPVDRIQAANAEQVVDEIKRLEGGIPAAERPAFQQATQGLLMADLVEAQFDEAKASASIHRRFNGKSAAELVAAYDRIDPGTRATMAAGIAEAKKQAGELKATVDRKRAELDASGGARLTN
jgi:hypothetical protein